jgi:signal transduction histidine kinase
VVGDHFGLPLVAGETTEVDLKGGGSAEMRVVELVWEGEPASLASLRDVTARHEAEAAARQLLEERAGRNAAEKERRRLNELLERAPVAILTTHGAEHRCEFANPRMRGLLGSSTINSGALRHSLGQLAGQGFIEGFDEAFTEARSASRTELPLQVEGPNGTVARYLDVTWEPLRQSAEEVSGVMCFAYDVTGSVQMRRDLQNAMAQLRREEERKDQFLAVLGHELRNPLAGISAGLDLVERGVAGEKRDWTLAMMRRQFGLVTALLDDLLDVSAIARGKLQLDRQLVGLSDVIEMAVAAVKTRFDKREQALSISLPTEAVAVNADRSRLAQVLANLLVNASKYSDRGSPVYLRVRREGEDAVIDVEDRGQGIEPELLDQMFEPFIQGRTGSPTAGGLGIGLTLVRQLTELHGGSVLASSPGPGRAARSRSGFRRLAPHRR